MLKELIENNMILVLPNNMKENVIKEVSSLDKIYNIKFMSLKELIDSLTFTYDVSLSGATYNLIIADSSGTTKVTKTNASFITTDIANKKLVLF